MKRAGVPVVESRAGGTATGRLREVARAFGWALAAILLILALFGAAAWHYRESLVIDAQGRAARLSSLLAEQAARTFEAVDFTLRGFDPLLDGKPAHDPALQALLRKRVAELSFVQGIRVLDASGAVVQSSDATDPRGDDPEPGYFKILAKDPAASIVIGHAAGEVGEGGRSAIPLARSLVAPDGRFAGVIVADIDPMYFSRFFHDLGLGRHAVVSLIEDDGNMLLASTMPVSSDPARTGQDDQAIPVLVRPAERRLLVRLREALQGQITSVHGTEGYPLAVSVGIDKGDLDVVWRKTVAPAFVLVLVIVALIVGLAITVERNRRERAEARHRAMLAQKLEAMGQMTASVSHDFRNILTAMAATVRLLRKRGPDETVLLEAESVIGRGNAMVDQLLAFSRRQDLTVEAADINTLVRQIEGVLRHVAGPDLVVVLDLAENLPACRTDRAQFDAALMNLAVNARQAIQGQGRISITTRLAGAPGAEAPPNGSPACVAVAVADTGCGIDEVTLKHVFEPFFTTKRETGTGLGLAQVYGFMRQIGGDVTVRSTVGSGTTVLLWFPVATKTPSAVLRSGPQVGPATLLPDGMPAHHP